MHARKILLAGWDAADWKVIRPLMDAGRMPNVRRLVEHGATGQIATLDPPLSPMLWTSIATGKRPFKHGIHGFSEPTPDGRGVQPVTNLSRKTKALWNILNQNDLRSVVIGWWPSHPAEPIDGVMVSDRFHRANRPLEEGWPLDADTVHPRELAETLAALRMHPDQLTPKMLEPFIPLAREINQDADKRLSTCMRILAECMSIHAAAMWLLEHRPWDFFAVYFDSIDHFCHGFMRYHPPRQGWVRGRDFELYRHVVTAGYELHDRMLGELMAKAGPETTVVLVSDHGFHPDHLRPTSIPDVPAGPAVEHRDLGVLAIAGPGIKQGEQLQGPSVLDIAPTLLALYGLPVGEDMDGKVLSQAFMEAPEVSLVPSWDDLPGKDGCHPPHRRLDAVAARAALEQLIALGYIERPDENRELAAEKTIRELQYNLGESYQDAGRHLEAHRIFTALCAADANEQRFAVRLFVSCQALGRRAEMRAIVDDLDGRRRALYEEARAKIGAAKRRDLVRWRELARFQPAVVDYLKAQVWIVEKRYAEALDALESVMKERLLRPGVLFETADLYARMGRTRDAQRVCEQALEIDPDNAQAPIGLCRIALRRRDYRAAAEKALDALQRFYRYPVAHFLLGRALEGTGDYARAAEAYRVAIALNPHFPQAHVRIASLLERHLHDVDAAREHRRLAQSMRRGENGIRPATEESCVAPSASFETTLTSAAKDAPPLAESLVVVTGLPRSGTSMLMQMLAAGGMPILADNLRAADDHNPRGYFEFSPVKKLLDDGRCLLEGRGKAVKIVAPLIAALPPGLPCRVILCQRDLEEVLDSQERMLAKRDGAPTATPERRRMLRHEYARMLDRVKAMLAARPETAVLVVAHRGAISDALGTAEKVNSFLGGGLDVAKMAGAIDPALYRNRLGELPNEHGELPNEHGGLPSRDREGADVPKLCSAPC